MFEQLKTDRKNARERGNPVLREKSFDFLIEQVEKIKPKRLLEIGTNEGLSGIGMLLSCDGELTGIEIDEEIAEKAKSNYIKYGVEKRANLFIGDAAEIVPMLGGKFDFIFLDGPKSHYAEYLPYLKNLLDKGGVLFADNVSFFGWTFNGEKPPHKHATIINGLRKFIKDLYEDKTLKTTIYDIEDGVSVTEKIQ